MREQEGPADRFTSTVSPDAGRGGTPWAATVLAAVVGLGLCLWGLDARSAWLDEAISRAATGQLAETLDNTGGTMGLYYLLLDGWTQLFGRSVTAMRALSALLVVATVVVVSRLAPRVVERSTATLAVVMVAVLPGITRYGQEARSYALTALIAALSWLCLVRAIDAGQGAGRGDASRWWMGVTLFSMLGVFAHGLFVLQVAAQGLSLAVAHRSAARRFAPAAIMAVLTAAMLFRSGADHVANWVPPLSLEQVGEVSRLLLNPVAALAAVVGLLVAIGTVRQVASARDDEQRAWFHVVPVFWAAGPVMGLLLLSVVRPYFLSRYLVASLPAIAILVAAGVADVDRRLRSRLPSTKPAVVAAPLLAVVLSAMAIGQVVTHRERNQDWRGATSLVAAGAEPGDAVLFTQQDLKLPFDVAWLEIDDRPDPAPPSIRPVQALGEPHRFAPVPSDAEVAAATDGIDRLWVVHQRLVSSGDSWLTVTLSTPVIEEEFREVRRWRLQGHVQVLLLERTR